MGKYKDVIGRMRYHLNKKDEGYNLPLFPIYNKTVGNIIPGVYTVIARATSSGRTSFVDTNYVMNTLLQWYESEDRAPLKILYFTLIDDGFKKTQKLLCAYMKLVENIRIDVPTLNSQPGRLYDIEERPDVLDALSRAEMFFEELEEEEVLEVIDGRKPPSEIFYKVADYMGEIGDDRDSKPYEPGPDHQDGLVMVVVDSVEGLAPEADGYGKNVRDELSRKMITYAITMAKRYHINVNLVVPTDTGFNKHPSNTIPNSSHLGIFGKNCHRGIIIYDPIGERSLKWAMPGEDKTTYISNGINTLRMWYVVRNTEGADVMFERYFMLPGTGYVVEHPLSNDINKFVEVYDILMETPSPYL